MCALEYKVAGKWNKQNLHVTTRPGFWGTAEEGTKLQNDVCGMLAHMPSHSSPMNYMFTSPSGWTDTDTDRQVGRQRHEQIQRKTS